LAELKLSDYDTHGSKTITEITVDWRFEQWWFGLFNVKTEILLHFLVVNRKRINLATSLGK
jgi:hypothetical protein